MLFHTQVLELGSGTGALAARLAAAGIEVICTDCSSQVGYVARRMDGVAGTAVLTLDWGAAGWSDQGPAVMARGPFSAIILAELYGLVEAHDVLFESVMQACREQAAATREPVVVWSIFKNRPFSLNFLGLLHDTAAFTWEMIEEFDRMGMDDEPGDEIYLHRLVYRSELDVNSAVAVGIDDAVAPVTAPAALCGAPAPAHAVAPPAVQSGEVTGPRCTRRVWGASRGLLEYLTTNAAEWGLDVAGVRVLELGAGTGWLATEVARGVAPAAALICATEMEAAGNAHALRQELLARAAEGWPGASSLVGAACDWGHIGASDAVVRGTAFTHILAADCYYNIDSVRLLAAAFAALLVQSPGATVLYGHELYRWGGSGWDRPFADELGACGLRAEVVWLEAKPLFARSTAPTVHAELAAMRGAMAALAEPGATRRRLPQRQSVVRIALAATSIEDGGVGDDAWAAARGALGMAVEWDAAEAALDAEIGGEEGGAFDDSHFDLVFERESASAAAATALGACGASGSS